MKDSVIQAIIAHKIIAVVRGVYGEEAVRLAEALCRGGVRLMECPFDQASEENRRRAAETVRLLKDKLGDRMVFGAGTVTSPELVRMAAEAGADYTVAPNTDPEVIRTMKEAGLVAIPGALTPTEIQAAHAAGADFIKIFPAKAMRPQYIAHVCTPFNNCRFLAVGGVTAADAPDYLRAGCVGVGVAGDLFTRALVDAGDFTRITENARRLTEAVKGI